MKIKIKKLSGLGQTPTQNKKYDAGYDLYSAENCSLGPNKRILLKTNISLSIPQGYYGRIADRSGNAYKMGVEVIGGVIDSPYRGDIGVILYNTDDTKTHLIGIGDRIAQIIIEKCHEVEFEEVDELDSTSRGENGYGSSGT